MPSAKDAVLMAFAADALSLGPHWEYEPKTIAKRIKDLSKVHDPISKYHPNRKAGEFTHYGDQMLVLLESLHAKKRFDLEDYLDRWQKLFDGYDGYVDGATKGTLRNIHEKKTPTGSDSHDFSAVGRIAPLFAFIKDQKNLEQAVKAMVAATHNNPEVVDAALYFMRVTRSVLDGKKVEEALRAEASVHIKELVEKGLATKGKPTTETIQKLGPACPVQGALPGTIHCLLDYSDKPEDALIACIAAGGDNSARAMVVGMVLGAAQGQTKKFTAQMAAYDHVKKLLG